MLRHSPHTPLVVLALAVGLSVALGVPLAGADAPGTSPGMPTQASVDLPSSDPSSYGAGWGDMPGGVAARPYVVSLTVVNGDVSTPVITNGTTASAPAAVGAVTTVISPSNLCRSGEAPAQGVCYATPNRVALTIGYGNNDNNGWDFSNPNVPVAPTIDGNSVIDMTVALNTLGKSLRWTWVNGDLLYWQTSNLGQDNATVHIKFKPATAPYVAAYAQSNGCTASPPMNCAIPQADGQVLAAELVFSLDDTLDPALTGAVFATQNAIAGFLTPGGTTQAPSLDVQLSSTHIKADGTPQLGTIEAFIPSAAMLNLYGILSSDSATAFTTARLGDAGTNDPPLYTPWTTAVNGSDGLLVTVTGITFSVPSYHVSSKLKPVVARAKTRGSKTTITASIAGCSKHKCRATVYNLGDARAARFIVGKTAVRTSLVAAARTLSITAPASKLKKGDRYLLVVRSANNKKRLASTIGTIG
jgi:hypothetical protein